MLSLGGAKLTRVLVMQSPEFEPIDKVLSSNPHQHLFFFITVKKKEMQG